MVPAGASADQIAQTVGYYNPSTQPRRGELWRTHRVYAGAPHTWLYNVYSGATYTPEEAEMPNEDLLFEFGRIACFNYALEGLYWGNESFDDPYVETMQGISMPARSLALRQNAAQNPDRVAAVNYRTRWSRSIVTVEAHQDHFLILQAAWKPSPHPEWMAAFNARYDTRYPDTIPVDALAAIWRYDYTNEQRLRSALDTCTEPGDIVFCLQCLGALMHNDLRLMGVLERFTGHPDVEVRREVAQIALNLGYHAVLLRMDAVETDDAFRCDLEKILFGSGGADDPPQEEA
jgi:hypothetical protein